MPFLNNKEYWRCHHCNFYLFLSLLKMYQTFYLLYLKENIILHNKNTTQTYYGISSCSWFGILLLWSKISLETNVIVKLEISNQFYFTNLNLEKNKWLSVLRWDTISTYILMSSGKLDKLGLPCKRTVNSLYKAIKYSFNRKIGGQT